MNAVAPLIPCIVSGGSGTRLWPVSRESMPKPFMRLADDQSLLQKTFLRIAGLPDVARLLTVTNRDLLFRTLDDYRAVNRSGLAQDLLLEPMGRNTAPAIAAAALHVQEHFGDQAQLLILPADHLIRDEQAFAAAVAEARGLATQGHLVTFGITRSAPRPASAISNRAPRWATASGSRASSRNPTRPPPSPTWTAASTCGTPACSASRPPPCCRNWSATRRRC